MPCSHCDLKGKSAKHFNTHERVEENGRNECKSVPEAASRGSRPFVSIRSRICVNLSQFQRPDHRFAMVSTAVSRRAAIGSLESVLFYHRASRRSLQCSAAVRSCSSPFHLRNLPGTLRTHTQRPLLSKCLPQKATCGSYLRYRSRATNTKNH